MAQRIPRRVQVLEKHDLTPQMVRIVFSGDELRDFGACEFTDHYVKLRIPPPGESDPRARPYPVADWEGEGLTIDFVVPGDEGVAGPWAAAAEPGDELLLLGPGGAETPDPPAARPLVGGDA